MGGRGLGLSLIMYPGTGTNLSAVPMLTATALLPMTCRGPEGVRVTWDCPGPQTYLG